MTEQPATRDTMEAALRWLDEAVPESGGLVLYLDPEHFGGVHTITINAGVAMDWSRFPASVGIGADRIFLDTMTHGMPSRRADTFGVLPIAGLTIIDRAAAARGDVA